MAIGIGRRQFISALVGATAWPLAARAQQAGKIFRIGFLGPSLGTQSGAAQQQVFLEQLKGLGFSEGQNLVVEYGRVDDPRGPFLATAELVRTPPDLIVAAGPEVALQAVIGASGFIPIVFQAVQYDPIERGYVASVAHPGGNITGLFYRPLELAAKQLELLTQALPGRTRLAILFDSLSADQFNAAKATAKAMSLELRRRSQILGWQGAVLERSRYRRFHEERSLLQ